MRLSFAAALLAAASSITPVDIQPVAATGAVATDPDDPAIWVHPVDPSRSLILGTNKVKAPDGALGVFSLDGTLRQTISGLDRPNNVDVEYGLKIKGRQIDIAVLTERLKQQLRVYAITSDGLVHIGAIPVFQGQSGEKAAPMGIALYKRPRDAAIFAVVGRKTGPAVGYLWQYRLEDDGSGGVRGVKVREFGAYSAGVDNEIEAIAVDDALGYVYYADERGGIRKYHADPDHRDAARELAYFGRDGFTADREGIAIYAHPDGTGYILCTDQIAGNSQYRIYRREGKPGRPHDHSELVKIVRGGADSTDGLEVTSRPLGPKFPRGALVAMNSSGRNFLIYSWDDIAGTGLPKLN
jgi:3-phytase